MTDDPAKKRLGRGLAALIGDMDQPVRVEETAAPAAQKSAADRFVPIELIGRNPANPRRDFDESDLDDLAAPIRAHGVVQPVVVRAARRGGNDYELIAGDRRWRAAQRAGLLNQLGVILALTILNLPFTLLLLKNFFDTVPIEIEEAAYVEGASLWQIVTFVVLPLSRAGIAVVWFFTFTSAWNEFLLPLIFARVQDAFPMSVGLYAAFGRQGAINYGFLAAYSIIYAAPAIAVYFLLRRNLNTGFAGVGVQG